MTSKKTKSSYTRNKYLKGFAFWNEMAFWRNKGIYSEETKAYFEKWLLSLRENENQLTKLEPTIKGNGVRV